MSANCWLGLSMEALSSAIVAFAAFASVGFAISGSLTAGAAGLVVTNAIMVTGLLAGGVQTATQLEVEMNAVERIRMRTMRTMRTIARWLFSTRVVWLRWDPRAN